MDRPDKRCEHENKGERCVLKNDVPHNRHQINLSPTTWCTHCEEYPARAGHFPHCSITCKKEHNANQEETSEEETKS